MLWTWAFLHLHPVEILPSTWNYAWNPIHNSHRHVEFRMHRVRVLGRCPNLCRWERKWPNGIYHGSCWHSTEVTYCKSYEEEVLFWRRLLADSYAKQPWSSALTLESVPGRRFKNKRPRPDRVHESLFWMEAREETEALRGVADAVDLEVAQWKSIEIDQAIGLNTDTHAFWLIFTNG